MSSSSLCRQCRSIFISGVITKDVVHLRKAIGAPRMALQFGFGSDSTNPHLPDIHEQNQVVYTGTHDNDTEVGGISCSKKKNAMCLIIYRFPWMYDTSWALILAALSDLVTYPLCIFFNWSLFFFFLIMEWLFKTVNHVEYVIAGTIIISSTTFFPKFLYKTYPEYVIARTIIISSTTFFPKFLYKTYPKISSILNRSSSI